MEELRRLESGTLNFGTGSALKARTKKDENKDYKRGRVFTSITLCFKRENGRHWRRDITNVKILLQGPPSPRGRFLPSTTTSPLITQS